MPRAYHPLRATCATLIVLTLAAARARAGNDDELLAGNQAAMMGGAVSASVEDGSAAWYNPAGLGAITRSQVDVSGTVYSLRFYRAPDFITLSTGESKDTSIAEFVSVPTQISYARALAPHATLALGYFVPQASNILLREQLVADSAAGHSEWQVAVASSRVLHNGVAALGFAVTPRLRLGFALIGSYEVESESSVIFGVVTPDDAVERLTQFTAIGTGGRGALELGLGTQVDVTERLALGVSARTPRLQLVSARDYVLTMAVGLGAQAGGPLLDGGQATAPDPDQHVALLRAGRLGLSVAYRYGERSRLCAELDVQPGIRDDAQGVRRRAVVNARIGVYHALSRAVSLGAGLFSDRSSDVLDGSPGNGTGDYYGGTLGVELDNEHRLAQGEPAGSMVFSTVFALRYAFSDGDIVRFGRLDELLVEAIEEPESDARGPMGTLISHELGFFVGGGLKF